MALVKVERLEDGKLIWVDAEKVNPDLHKPAGQPKQPKKRGKKNADPA